MQLLRWNYPGAGHQTSVFHGERGWMSRNKPAHPAEFAPFGEHKIASVFPHQIERDQTIDLRVEVILIWKKPHNFLPPRLHQSRQERPLATAQLQLWTALEQSH